MTTRPKRTVHTDDRQRAACAAASWSCRHPALRARGARPTSGNTSRTASTRGGSRRSGAYVDRFEQASRPGGARHAVATASGTAALHTRCSSPASQPDDEVLVSTLTFIAPANAMRYVGAWPVFIDAEPTLLADGRRQGCADFPRARVRTGVRSALTTGGPAAGCAPSCPSTSSGIRWTWTPLLELAREYGLTVIEDATESLGATYRDRPVGQLGAHRLLQLQRQQADHHRRRRHARHRQPGWADAREIPDHPGQGRSGRVRAREIGYNYRLTNVQAAIGVAQLEQLDELRRGQAADRRAATRRRWRSVARPHAACGEAPWAHSAFWMYTVSDRRGSSA